jgi:CRP/FNR family transcriptional regulator, cyclic AMP receptor protein
MIGRFEGAAGRHALIEILLGHTTVVGRRRMAEALADKLQLLAIAPNAVIVEQGGGDNDVFFIIAGSFDIEVNGRKVAIRGPTDCVGEMAAVVPSQRRSATVRATEASVVGKLSAADFTILCGQYPDFWHELAKIATRRLYQRNALVRRMNESIAVFIMSSVEGLPIARAIHNNFAHDPFFVKIWTDGTFRASEYPVESLVNQVDQSDFAIAVVHGDDQLIRRAATVLTPRDNVIFELGLFIGRIGRPRAFLVEPRGGEVVLPTDLAGITTLHYRPDKADDLDGLLGPACNKLREIFMELGPS